MCAFDSLSWEHIKRVPMFSSNHRLRRESWYLTHHRPMACHSTPPLSQLAVTSVVPKTLSLSISPSEIHSNLDKSK